MTAVTVDDGAWEAFDDATGDTLSRDAIRATLVGTAALHAAEGASAYVAARARPESPARPAGACPPSCGAFPVLFRLRKAKRLARGLDPRPPRARRAGAQKCQG